MSLSLKIAAFIFGVSLYGLTGLMLANAANTDSAEPITVAAQ